MSLHALLKLRKGQCTESEVETLITKGSGAAAGAAGTSGSPGAAAGAAVAAGVDVNERDGEARTPLHVAARLGLEGVVRLLLQNKADLTIEDDVRQQTERVFKRFCSQLILAAGFHVFAGRLDGVARGFDSASRAYPGGRARCDRRAGRGQLSRKIFLRCCSSSRDSSFSILPHAFAQNINTTLDVT